MTAVRALLVLVGAGALWYGATLLLDLNAIDLRSAALWFAGGILVHDFVFAPLCALTGRAARRLLPSAWWSPAAYGAVCTVTLLAVAVPVVGRERAMADNSSILNRPYTAGLAVALVLVWASVGAVLFYRTRRH